MTSDQSSVEKEMKQLLKECEDIVDDSYLTTNDARKIMDKAYKMLAKCEELRIGRDNLRDKYRKLKNTIKRVKMKK